MPVITYRPEHLPIFFWVADGPYSFCRCGWFVPRHDRCDEESVRYAMRRHAGLLDPR